MQTPNQTPASSTAATWLFVFCAIQALGVVLSFFGINWSSLHSRLGVARSSKPRVYTLWVGVLTTGSLAFAGTGFYLLFHVSHPYLFRGLAGTLAFLVAGNWYLVFSSPRELEQLQHPVTKLVIHSANYRACNGEGEVYDVADFLRQIIGRDGLVFDIENHNFVDGDHNFVPRDPKDGKEKRLQVTYSYGNDPSVVIERKEHDRLVLPEDTFLKKQAGSPNEVKPSEAQSKLDNMPKVRVVKAAIDIRGKVSLTIRNLGNATARGFTARKWIEAGNYVRGSAPVSSGAGWIARFSTKDLPSTSSWGRSLEPGEEYVFSWDEDVEEKRKTAEDYPGCVILSRGELSYNTPRGASGFSSRFSYVAKPSSKGWVIEKSKDDGANEEE